MSGLHQGDHIFFTCLIWVVLGLGCASDEVDESFKGGATQPEAVEVQELDLSIPSPQLAQQIVQRELSQRDDLRLMERFAQEPHAWLDQIYSYLDQTELSRDQTLAQCDLIRRLRLSEISLNAHQLDPYAVKEFPVWYHLFLDNYCQTLLKLNQDIAQIESDNLSNRATRAHLKRMAGERALELIGAISRRDEVAQNYWLLKGILVNPSDSVYEISLPNLFESKSLICTSSTECSSMSNIKAKIRGGARDRVLLNSVTRYHSKGRIEMLVSYERTETLYTRRGQRVEWAVLSEASHYPLLSAQRDYLRAQEASEAAELALKNAPEETDLSKAYTARTVSLDLLKRGLSTYLEAREQLPKYMAAQDLWMRAELYDLCDQLEWEGIGALKRRSTKVAYREDHKPVRSLLKRTQRITCDLTSMRRTALDRFEGVLRITTYRKHRKPKGSALATRYHVNWEVVFSPEGEMTLERFNPQAEHEEATLVETPPSLARKRIARRYKLHRPKLTLKRDYAVCSSGIQGYKSQRLRREAGLITTQDQVTSIGKPRRGSVKVKLFGRRPVYLSADQTCIKRERQDGNFRSLYSPNVQLDQIEVSDLPSAKGERSVIQSASLFIFEHKVGEKRRWSSGWVLNGAERGRRVFVKSEDLKPKTVDTEEPTRQPI